MNKAASGFAGLSVKIDQRVRKLARVVPVDRSGEERGFARATFASLRQYEATFRFSHRNRFRLCGHHSQRFGAIQILFGNIKNFCGFGCCRCFLLLAHPFALFGVWIIVGSIGVLGMTAAWLTGIGAGIEASRSVSSSGFSLRGRERSFTYQ